MAKLDPIVQQYVDRLKNAKTAEELVEIEFGEDGFMNAAEKRGLLTEEEAEMLSGFAEYCRWNLE